MNTHVHLKNRILPKLSYLLCVVLFFNTLILNAQDNPVFVDKNGVMRWSNNKEEVHGFGVNYTVPFAHGYRSAKRLGIDIKQAIDNDIYHLSRLGFDLFRIHVWDTEISDAKGNLLQNDHLDTFDYLIAELKKKDFNFVLTPIAFWGNGWPEPDTDSPGFSHKYGKADCLTNPDAIKAQKNYLVQFLNHINPYTGIAYKNEPHVIAFEVSNEPHHSGSGTEVTKFVSGMVKAMKSTGTQKPIFYNISHGVHFVDDYFKAGIQGGTFQWYPTGLGYQKELSGNLLPNVNDYNIPFNTAIKKHHGAKLVYEFDAADVGKSYIYPAMARSFRTAGIQIATQFAYDPTYTAYANTEYNTHYMNLLYTPKKALSLMICSEIFHNTPMYTDFGMFPQNTSFNNTTIDYNTDLAVYNSENTFIYTNTNTTTPKKESELKQIAGFGNSKLVEYNGSGAYFLDQITPGVWRLEVLPDAVWVNDPFGKNSPKKTIAVLNWKEQNMSVSLQDLKTNFSVKAINKGNTFNAQVTDNGFKIIPGTYLLIKHGTLFKQDENTMFKHYPLNAFFAPQTTVSSPWLKHNPIGEASEKTPLTIRAQFIAPQTPTEISLVGFIENHHFNIPLHPVGNYQYKAVIPAEYMVPGYLNYNILIKTNKNDFITYPSGDSGRPFEWDFYSKDSYKTVVVPHNYPIHLFDALEDSKDLVIPWRKTITLRPAKTQNKAEYNIAIDSLSIPDNENLKAEPIHDFSFKHFILNKIEGRADDLSKKQTLRIEGHALNNKPCKIQVAFVTKTGASYGHIIEMTPETNIYNISLTDLKPVKTVILPRPYPSFLPYFLEHNITAPFNINDIESLQFSIGPGIPKAELTAPHGFTLIAVDLE